MIRPLFIALLLSLIFVSSPLCRASLAADPQKPAAQAEVIDGVAAIVNGDVITYSQVRQVVTPRERLLRSQFKGEELMKQVKTAREAALKDLIDRQLIIQAFKKEGFQIPDHYLDARLNDLITEHFGGDRTAFVKTLQADNYTLGEFKKNELDKMIVQAMRSKNVKTTTVVSPTRVDEYYRQHREEFTSKEQIKLRMIMIPSRVSEGGGSSQKALAEEILGKIVKGTEFESMAQLYSEDSTKERGGDWGWIERKTLADPLEKVAFRLPAGKVSNIVDFGGNYYILKVEEKRGGDTKPLAKAREEIEKKLLSEEARARQEQWIASLRQKAYIQTF